MSPADASAFLANEVLVEEKVDGANVGFSVDEDGQLRAQNRGAYLTRVSSHPQFKPLFRWMDERREALVDALFPNLVLFGEWCYAVHSIRYTRLPDWFLAFDVFDLSRSAFWSAHRRDALAARLHLAVVPQLARGRFDLAALTQLSSASRLTDGPAEGVYVRRDEREWLVGRAKLVRPEFVQSIAQHWSRRTVQTNALAAWERRPPA